MKLSCQEHLLPGATLQEKFDAAVRTGFEAIELRSAGDLRPRLAELRRAARDGVVMRTACVDVDASIGDAEKKRRRDAVNSLKLQLSILAELGGAGVITAASPSAPPGSSRSQDEGREVLTEALAELGEHAEREGVLIMLEPRNRYEDDLVNRLEQAVDLCRGTGLESVRIVADTYHMNIEEADPCGALRRAAPHLAHVQVSDSNRLPPSSGHLDWAPLLATLDAVGYDGHLALECELPDPAEDALPRVCAFLRRMA